MENIEIQKYILDLKNYNEKLIIDFNKLRNNYIELKVLYDRHLTGTKIFILFTEMYPQEFLNLINKLKIQNKLDDDIQEFINLVKI